MERCVAALMLKTVWSLMPARCQCGVRISWMGDEVACEVRVGKALKVLYRTFCDSDCQKARWLLHGRAKLVRDPMFTARCNAVLAPMTTQSLVLVAENIAGVAAWDVLYRTVLNTVL